MALTKIPEAMLQNEKIYLPSSIQRFTSGSGTYGLAYWFIISTGSATAGATYTNNAQTFTVLQTASSSNLVLMSSTGAPSTSGTLAKSTGTGDASIIFSSYRAPIEIEVEMCGGGAGGGGSGTGGAGVGTAGGNTTFGSSLLTCNGGAVGSIGGGSFAGGAGGTAIVGAGAIVDTSFSGSYGGAGQLNNSTSTSLAGGNGGTSGFGIIGSATYNLGTPAPVPANTGAGGAGAGSNTVGGLCGSGPGGGGGAYIKALIINPSATYSYSVGSGGSAGAAGTSGAAGAAGSSGIIIVRERYQ